MHLEIHIVSEHREEHAYRWVTKANGENRRRIRDRVLTIPQRFKKNPHQFCCTKTYHGGDESQAGGQRGSRLILYVTLPGALANLYPVPSAGGGLGCGRFRQVIGDRRRIPLRRDGSEAGGRWAQIADANVKIESDLQSSSIRRRSQVAFSGGVNLLARPPVLVATSGTQATPPNHVETRTRDVTLLAQACSAWETVMRAGYGEQEQSLCTVPSGASTRGKPYRS